MADLISPFQTADFLLVESRERGDVLTNLKLQKLLYYAQAWFLTFKDCALFQEDFRAWAHGPVLPTQYYRFKDYQWRPIDDNLELPNIENAIAEHLVEIVDVFGVESAVSLELMTHRERPWLEARGNIPMDAISNARISKESMMAFYKELAGEA